MKIFVLGACGMAGHVVGQFLCEAGHHVIGFARTSAPYCDTIIGDARDTVLLKKTVEAQDFDAVVNCIGRLNTAVDEEPALSIYVNSVLPHLLAKYTAGSRTKVLHLSTDCVFSGKTGGYEEDSFCDADSMYGRSKALGELKNDKDLTIRTSIVGPSMRIDGQGLLHWFMRQQEVVEGYRFALWTGITTVELAKAIEHMLRTGVSGLCHLVNGEKISKYELLKLFNQLRGAPIEICPSDQIRVDKSLRCTRKDLDWVVPPYQQMIREMGRWIVDHPRLYPYYQLGRRATSKD